MGKYGFGDDNTLELYIQPPGFEQRTDSVPLADLTINGVAPSSKADALTKLEAVFPDAGGSAEPTQITLSPLQSGLKDRTTADGEYLITDSVNTGIVVTVVEGKINQQALLPDGTVAEGWIEIGDPTSLAGTFTPTINGVAVASAPIAWQGTDIVSPMSAADIAIATAAACDNPLYTYLAVNKFESARVYFSSLLSNALASNGYAIAITTDSGDALPIVTQQNFTGGTSFNKSVNYDVNTDTVPPITNERKYAFLITTPSTDYITSGELVIGRKYQINFIEGGPLDDFTNVGAPDNNEGTQFIATGTTPADWSHSTPIHAMGVPEVIVLKNEFAADVAWSRANSGEFEGYSSSPIFTENKTSNTSGISGIFESSAPIYNFECRAISQNSCKLQTCRISDGQLTDGALNKKYIEITVYP